MEDEKRRGRHIKKKIYIKRNIKREKEGYIEDNIFKRKYIEVNRYKARHIEVVDIYKEYIYDGKYI